MAKHAIYAKTTSRFDAASKGVYHMLLRLQIRVGRFDSGSRLH